MKRVLKFRAYNKETEKMTDWETMNALRNFHKLLSLSFVHLMQETPFTDINKKIVYEGDLVRDVIVGLVSEVVFTDWGNFGLRPINGEVKDLEYDPIDPAWFSTSAMVIGNIYGKEVKNV